MKNLEKAFKKAQEITLVDTLSNEEFTGNVAWTAWDIVSLKNVKGFKGTAIFMMNQFKLKA